MNDSDCFVSCVGLQQHLPLAVCDEGCEAAEEQSDDEAHTSLVPDRREGKTKVMKQQHLPLAVLKHAKYILFIEELTVATAPTVCGIETEYQTLTSSIHYYSVATVLTACGIETPFLEVTMKLIEKLLQQYLPFTVLKHCTVVVQFPLC